MRSECIATLVLVSLAVMMSFTAGCSPRPLSRQTIVDGVWMSSLSSGWGEDVNYYSTTAEYTEWALVARQVGAKSSEDDVLLAAVRQARHDFHGPFMSRSMRRHSDDGSRETLHEFTPTRVLLRLVRVDGGSPAAGKSTSSAVIYSATAQEVLGSPPEASVDVSKFERIGEYTALDVGSASEDAREELRVLKAEYAPYMR